MVGPGHRRPVLRPGIELRGSYIMPGRQKKTVSPSGLAVCTPDASRLLAPNVKLDIREGEARPVLGEPLDWATGLSAPGKSGTVDLR